MRSVALVLVILTLTDAVHAGEKDIVNHLSAAGAIFRTCDAFGESDILIVRLVDECVEEALPYLCELRRLRGVGLSHPSMTDAHLRTICGLPQLRVLTLDGSSVTDAQMKLVTRALGLKSLSFTGTAVTDVGLAEVGKLHGLEMLRMDATNITDVGLRRLEKLGGLTVLDLRNCPGVTAQGVARLRKALPDCRIIR
jgi:hypothetical protein